MRPFATLEEAIDRANDTPYGLGAGIWTTGIQESELALKKIKAGMIWINCYNDNPAYLPFGGYKHSGNDVFLMMAGYGKDLGEEAIAEFSILKSVQCAI